MDTPTNLDSLLDGSKILQKSGMGGRAPTLYDLLQVDASATKTRVREAYIRLKHTYSSQSQALYSLLDDEDARRSMAQVEEAFKILNDDIARKDYDDKLNSSGLLPQPTATPESYSNDPFGGTGDFNVSPAKERVEFMRSRRAEADQPAWTQPEIEPLGAHPTQSTMMKTPKEYASTFKVTYKAHSPGMKELIDELLAAAPEKGDGTLYRKIREMLDVSETEVQTRTRISLDYIRAIESNSFERLPALVYVRGFLKSYLQYLGVPDPKAIVEAFSERVQAWQKTRTPN